MKKKSQRREIPEPERPKKPPKNPKRKRDDSLKKKSVEVCANCGKVADSSDYKDKDFVCSKCGCNVSVVLPKEMFDKLIKEGFGKKE